MRLDKENQTIFERIYSTDNVKKKKSNSYLEEIRTDKAAFDQEEKPQGQEVMQRPPTGIFFSLFRKRPSV